MADIYSNTQLNAHYQRANGFNAKNPDFLLKYAQNSAQESLNFVKNPLKLRKTIEKSDNLDINIAPQSLDAVISILQFHFKNDIALELNVISSKLKKDGLFIANFFGGRTLTELRQSMQYAEQKLFGGNSPRICPMVDVKTAGDALKQAGFALPVATQEQIEVEYDDIYHLIKHLRKTGLTNPMHSKHRSSKTSRALFAEADKFYKANFASKNKILASYELITISGWKPSETQQQPLTRGSGKVNLNKVL